MNTEFQRIARRDKKVCLSDQCKEVEENDRKGKTRDLFKKIRDPKGTFHANMDTIKDRNGMGLTESESESEVAQSYPTLWTVGHQAPLSMGFPRQEYWSGLPFSSPGDLPDPGIKPGSPALQADALTSEPPGKPTFVGSSKKQENSGKTSNSALLTAKAFDFVDHNKLWNSLKEMEYQTSSSAS